MEIKYRKNVLASLEEEGVKTPLVLVVDEGSQDLAEKVKPGPEAVLIVKDLTSEALEMLAGECGEAATVVALGGTDAVMAGRWVAWKKGASLIIVPSPIQGEELVRPDVLYYKDSVRASAGKHDADLLLIDATLLWDRREEDTKGAVGEVLSIAIAAEDWRRQGQQAGYDEKEAEKALDIMADVFDRADDIFELTDNGVMAIVDGLARREGLARELEHRKAVEGPEHIFADCLEKTLKRRFPRGRLLCLASVMMAEMHGKPSKPAKQFLHWINVKWKPEDLGLNKGELGRTLGSVQEFAKKHGRVGTTLDDFEMDGKAMQAIIQGAYQTFLVSSFQERED